MVCRLLQPEPDRERSAYLFAASWDTLLFGGCKYFLSHERTKYFRVILFELNSWNSTQLVNFSIRSRSSHKSIRSWSASLFEFWMESL